MRLKICFLRNRRALYSMVLHTVFLSVTHTPALLPPFLRTKNRFIEQQGRWATPEMEAAMRAGVRRDVRKRREMEEEQKRETLIMDDDEDEDYQDEPQDLGDGMFGKLGSAADAAVTAEATSPRRAQLDTYDDEDEEDEDDGLDDFLLDLGLDSEGDDGGNEPSDTMAGFDSPTTTRRPRKTGLEDVVVGDDGDDDDDEMESGVGTASISVDDDDDDELELGLDDDGGLSDDGGVSTVPLEDFGDSDSLDTEEFFDDGGFDYDGGDDFGDGGDGW